MRCLMGRISIWNDEKVVKMDGADGCTTMNELNDTELYALKWLKW